MFFFKSKIAVLEAELTLVNIQIRRLGDRFAMSFETHAKCMQLIKDKVSLMKRLRLLTA